MKKAEIIKYLKNHELDIQSAVASYLLLSVAFRSYMDANELLGLDYSPYFSYFERSYKGKPYFSQIVSKKQIEDNSDKVFFDYLKDYRSFDRFMKNHKKSGEKALAVWKEYKKTKKKDKNLLRRKMAEFLKKDEIFWFYALAAEDKGGVIEREIVSRFAKLRNISQEKSREIIEILSHPKEPAIFNVERKDFFKLCLKFIESRKKDIKRDVDFADKLDKEIKTYLGKYFWFKTDFYSNKRFNKNIVISEIKKEISENNQEGIKKEIKKIEESFLEIEKKKESLSKKLKLKKEEKMLIDFAEKFSLWMDKRKQWMMEEVFYFFNLAEEISRIWKISYEDLSLYGKEEMIELLENEKKLDEKTLKIRRGEFLVVAERGKRDIFLSGKDVKDILSVALGKSEKKIKGTVASVGKKNIVFGRARIVIHTDKDVFKKNEILITSMTRVEFVPLMKKAKAVITDEGGTVCHAAIVSRELGLPAIIGTKNASKRIKNGDMIEMNMKTGEIKIIS